MSTPIHPSSDELSAYFDQEIPPTDRASVSDHLTRCPECRSVVDGFSLLEELGPVVEEMLPGEAYWLDLPDRILARLAQDADAPAVAPAEAEPGASFWHRLWNPTGAWRWALGSVATLVLVAGSWWTFHEPRNPVDPVGRELAQEGATRDPGGAPEAAVPAPGRGLVGTPLMNGESDPVLTASVAADHEPATSPEAFSRRVVTTLGGRNDLGTSLDLAPGQAVGSMGVANAGPGSQVSFDLPP